MLEKLSKSYPPLPTELVILIMTTAAARHLPTAARLCQVSSWVRKLVEPILYRVVVLVGIARTELLSSPKFHALTRHLGMFGFIGWYKCMRSGPVKLQIRSLATTNCRHELYIDCTHLEELHVTSPDAWGPSWSLPNQIQRLHVWCLPSDPENLLEAILRQPCLSHIAFSVSKNSHADSPALELVLRLLRDYKSLKFLLLRLPLESAHEQGEHGTLSLASIKDPRFVVKHVDFGLQENSMRDEWEYNALHGVTIWSPVQIGKSGMSPS